MTESTAPGAGADGVDAHFAALVRSSRRSGLLSALGLVVLLGSIAYSYVQLGSLNAQIDQKRRELGALQADLEAANTALTAKQQELNKITPAALQGLGYKDPYAPVSPQAVSESVDAKRAAEALATPAERDRRRSIRLQYYAKKLDDEVNMRAVLAALEDAGFVLERKPAQLPGIPTNAIFFGPGVKNEDIQLVALTVIGAGIKIRTVERLDTDVSKPRLIQIGARSDKQDAPALTAEQVRRHSFTN